jgi:hypothetical protein
MVSIIDHHAGKKKSAIKRDGPVFFSSAPVKVAGDERTIMAIVAPRRGETSRPADISSGKPAGLPQLKNLSVCRCCHREIPMNQIPFRESNRCPPFFIFYPCPSMFIRGFKKHKND